MATVTMRQGREPRAETPNPAPAEEPADSNAADLPSDVSVTRRRWKNRGRDEELLVVTFGQPQRKVELVELDLGDQFDLAEVTGASGGNAAWSSMAFIAASVRTIDNDPVGVGYSKQVLRETLRRLGIDGMKAAGLVLNGYRGGAVSEEAHRETVGGS